MIRRILNSRNFVATSWRRRLGWMALYFRLPFPSDNVFLQLALRAPLVHQELFYSYNLSLFTTPYIGYSILLSGLYVFGLRVRRKTRVGKLPPYPEPGVRDDLFLVVGPQQVLPFDHA